MVSIYLNIFNFIVIKILLKRMRTMSKRLTIEEHNRIAYAKIKLKELLDSPNCIELIRQNPNYDYMMHVIAHREAD